MNDEPKVRGTIPALVEKYGFDFFVCELGRSKSGPWYKIGHSELAVCDQNKVWVYYVKGTPISILGK